MLMKLLLGAMLLLLPALAAAQERLVIGISQFPGTMHPSFGSMMAKSYVAAMTRRKITVYDPDWKLTCLLCTELPDLEKGTAEYVDMEDGTPGIAVTFELDPRAVWGDGTPITTKDVLFTWRVGRNETTGVDNQELYRRIENVVAHDERRFTMHINKRTCEYQAVNDFNLLPAHIDTVNFDPEPREYQHRTAYVRNPADPGLWYGPYRLAEIVPGQHIRLVRNERWWGKRPHFDEILVRVIENTTSLSSSLLSGEIDMIAGEVGLSMDQALSFEQRAGDRFQFLYRAGLFYEHIDLNLDNPILADRRVRRALLMGLDRDAISQQLFAGRQSVAHGQTHPLDDVYNENLPKYAHDPKAAASLLEEAGWTRGPRGIRQNADGQPLQLELMTTAGNKTRKDVQQVLQAQWKQLGIDVRLRNQLPRIFFGDTVSKRQFSGLAMFAWFSSPRNIPRSTLHSDMIPVAATNWAGQNYTGFRNAEMDRVLDDVEVKCEPSENMALWHKLQKIYAEELPALPLYYRANTFILPKDLQGLTPTGHQYPSTNWVENWTR